MPKATDTIKFNNKMHKIRFRQKPQNKHECSKKETNLNKLLFLKLKERMIQKIKNSIN